MSWPRRFAGVRALLLSDPIGFRDEPAAQDECDACASVIVDMINAGRSETELADYLVSLETDAMGLEADRRRAESVATKLTAPA